MRRRFLALGAVAGVSVAALAARFYAKRNQYQKAVLFIGTQADAPGQGIFSARLDERTGRLFALTLAAEVARPTWVQRDRTRPLLFAVSEMGNSGDRDGEVLSFSIASDRLVPAGRASSGGGGATHLEIDAASGTLFVANYAGSVAASSFSGIGTIAAPVSIHHTHGSGPHRRQTGPHPHGVTLTPDARFVLVPDMGADRVFFYRFDAATRSLSPAVTDTVTLPAGSGPRLMLFDRGGRYVYLLTELSAELFVFAWDATNGSLTQVQSIALDAPGNAAPRSAAVLLLSANGRFLYASNRTTNTIQVYAIDRRSGRLLAVQSIAAGGAKPWGAAFSPSGRWLVVANQGSDQVNALAIDRRTGKLSVSASSLSVPTPTGLAFA